MSVPVKFQGPVRNDPAEVASATAAEPRVTATVSELLAGVGVQVVEVGKPVRAYLYDVVVGEKDGSKLPGVEKVRFERRRGSTGNVTLIVYAPD